MGFCAIESRLGGLHETRYTKDKLEKDTSDEDSFILEIGAIIERRDLRFEHHFDELQNGSFKLYHRGSAPLVLDGPSKSLPPPPRGLLPLGGLLE